MRYDKENIFAKILRREIPCTKLYEDDYALAFEDINPQAPIHVLVIPKGEYVAMDDFISIASDAEISGFFRAVANTARQLELVLPGYRILSNIGEDGMQEVPHLHIHIFGGKKMGPMVVTK
jgi:diadenosine tetraphosphate (Ap4A) HIT family hydrolase